MEEQVGTEIRGATRHCVIRIAAHKRGDGHTGIKPGPEWRKLRIEAARCRARHNRKKYREPGHADLRSLLV
jgi:hypothetical protein